MKVRDAMTTDVVTTTADTPLKEAAHALAQNAISGMPVVGAGGSVLGVLSEADILAKQCKGQGQRKGLLRRLLDPTDPWLESRFSARTVGEAMSAPARSIEPDRPIADAATLMLEHEVKRLTVVDADGKLLGLISRGDLVRAFVRTDGEIKREIEEDLLRTTLWIDHPEDVHVTVSKGVVTLAGKVDSAADADLVSRSARWVPGVVAVTSKLTPRAAAGAARR